MSDLNTALAKFGGTMFDLLFERFCDGDFEIEIGDLIQLDAVRAGLVEKTQFDPEQHTDEHGYGAEAGDDWFVLTGLGQQAIRSLRTKKEAA